MALPVKQKTWVIDPCNRIVYSSLVQVAREFMFQAKEFLKANGYAVKGSSTGAAAAMDGVDRWAAATDAGTRGANTTTANSWVVLTDANGVNICLSYASAADDRIRIAFSPGGLYVAAGTATFTPTATDERVIFDGSATVVGSTASGDRLWSGWVDSTHKSCRFAIARGGLWVGLMWGVEELNPTIAPSVTFSPPTWGFCYTNGTYLAANVGGATSSFTANSKGGVARVNTGVAVNVDLGGCCESMSATGSSGVGTFGGVAAELQGNAYPLLPLGVSSGIASARGRLGTRYDTYLGRTQASGAADGDIYGNGEWIQLGEMVWPWDGTPTVAGTTVVMT